MTHRTSRLALLGLLPVIVAGVTSMSMMVSPTGGDAAERDAAPRVLLVYDVEGASGSIERGDYRVTSDRWTEVRESLIEDINAAARGLLRAGAREVVVADAHASGGGEPDYPPEAAPEGVRVDIRAEPFDPYVDAMDPTYDALVMIGMHARSGSEGFAPHTYFGNIRWWMNDVEMSETSMVALSAARYRIPLILVAGDDVHMQEVAEFSDAEYVVVKRTLSTSTAESRGREVVSAELEETAYRALRNRNQYEPFDLSPPLRHRFNFRGSFNTALAASVPGMEVKDDRTIAFTTDNYLDALLLYRTMAVWLFYARNYEVVQAVQDVEGGQEILRQARESMPSEGWEPTGGPEALAEMLQAVTRYDRWGYR